VSGELGGNHVHFEIDKNASGRPAYAFTNCADVPKGHYKIIQDGLCRVELFQYTKDPIVLLEGAKAKYPSLSAGNPSENSNEQHPAPVVPEQPSTPDLLPPSPSQVGSSALTLDLSKVDLVGKEFVNKRDISIEKNFGEVVGMNDDLTFTLKIKNKVTGEAFHGTLSQPVLLIASNTHINLNPVSTVLVSHGIATIKMTPKTKGSVYIAVNLGTAKIGGVSVSIQ
jgi:hypothetical protein